MTRAGGKGPIDLAGAALAGWIGAAAMLRGRAERLRGIAPAGRRTRLMTAALTGLAAATLLAVLLLAETGPLLQQADAHDAPSLMIRYGCAGCHTIAGVPGARGQVGPSLVGLKRRLYIGGAATNSRENLERWLIDPKAVNPRTAMPLTGLNESEARIVAAYLLGEKPR